MITMLVGIVACTLGVYACPSAIAGATWLPPSVLSASGVEVMGSTALAADPKGDAVSVWWREGVGIEGAFRLAESPNWSVPEAVGSTVLKGETPQVGMDAQGDAVAVWTNGSQEKVEASTRPASSGLWQTPAAISPEGGGSSLRPQVAVDARGDAVAVWSFPYPEDSPGAVVNETIQAAMRPDGADHWEPAAWVSELGKAPNKNRFSRAPQVAMDAEGEAVAVWEDQASENASDVHDLIEAAVKPPNSPVWGPPVVLAEAGRQPQVAMDARGDATAVWPAPGGLYSATLPTLSSTWQPVVPISSNEAEHPHVGMDSLGNAVVAWESIGATTNTVQAAVRSIGTMWGAPANLSEPVEYSHGYPTLNPSVAIDAKGSAAVSWDGFRSLTDQTVQVAILPAIGDSWQTPLQLADVGGSFVSPLVNMDEKGNGTSTWARSAGSNSAVEAANYDGSSPTLDGASIPSTAETDKPLVFAVSPLAVTTALGQTSWSFGDGSQSAAGTSVNHAFMKPGSYRVTVTTADVLGNTTSASSTILVTNAPTRPRCKCRRSRLTMSNVRVTSRHFRVTGPPIEKRLGHRTLPLGTAFRFTLSENASVRIQITAIDPRSCKKLANRCTNERHIGTLRSAGVHAGNDGISFRGWVGKHALRPGRYRATLTAYNGSAHSPAVSVQFWVVR